MNSFFDENFPRPLRRFLTAHIVKTAQQMEWAGIDNGDLLDIAQAEFTGRGIAVVTLRARDNRIPTLVPLIPQIFALLPIVQPGQFYVVEELPEEEAEPELAE